MRAKLVICTILCAATTVAGGCAPLVQKSTQRSLLEPSSQEPTVATPQSRPTAAKVTWAQRTPLSQEMQQPETIPPPPREAPPRRMPLDPPEPDVRGERFVPPPKPSDGLRPIGALTVGIAPPQTKAGDAAGELPENLALQRFGDLEPIVVGSEPFQPWNAYGQLVLSSDFCHQPLYFEDANLERYGRSHGVFQPFISAAKFYGSVPALPYKMVTQPPRVCLRDDSRWPAGGMAPHQRSLPPVDVKAGVVEAAVIVGLILLIP